MLAKRFACYALSVTLCGVGFTCCGKKEEAASAPGGDQEVATKEAVEVAPPTATASASERAARLGFARYLPADTEGFLGFYDGAGLVADLRASKFGGFLEQMAASEGMDLDDLNENPQAGMFLSLLKEEMFIAVGKGTPAQSTNLLNLQALNTYAQMKMLVQMAAAEVTGDAPDILNDPMAAQFGFLQESEKFVAILDGSQMPPITIGFKVSDEEARNGLGQMIAGGLGEGVSFLGPDGEDVAEAVSIPAGDSTLTGIRFVGEKVVAKMKEEGAHEEMSGFLGAATAAKVLESLSKKNALAAAGVVGDYVVIFVGSDAGEFALAESADQSILTNPELAFVDPYLDKKLTVVTTLSKELMGSVGDSPNGLGNLAAGIKAGLQATEVFGDTQDLEVLLDLVGKQEEAIMEMVSYLPAALVGYREEGFKIEGHGGSTRPDVDLTATHKYGALSDWDGALFHAGAIGRRDYAEKCLEWLDTIGEAAYLAGKQISQVDASGGDFRDFQQGFAMFDEMFRDDMLTLWKALRDDMHTGLGDECVVLVDLKGGLPTVPGLAAPLLDEGKAPRVALVAPIAERERLGQAWEKVNGSLESILAKVSEMSGNNIPMQKPMSSEKDDLVTWFFNIPFQTDDFLLSVSLDKDTFYMTTSKKFAQEIGAKVAAGEASVTGEHMHLDLANLRAYISETLTLIENNADEIFPPGGGEADEFRRNLPQIREVLDACSDLQAFSLETQLEGGLPHTTIHLHVD